MFLVILCGSVIVAAGCGDNYPRRYPVSGFVKFPDGSPVMTGTVEVGIPGSQWTASGKIARDGSFTLGTVNTGDGAILGEHKVIVRQIIVNYLPAAGGHDHGKLVDLKYSDYKTSPLVLTVTEDGNQNVQLIVEPR